MRLGTEEKWDMIPEGLEEGYWHFRHNASIFKDKKDKEEENFAAMSVSLTDSEDGGSTFLWNDNEILHIVTFQNTTWPQSKEPQI
jgi:hypothetical protein